MGYENASDFFYPAVDESYEKMLFQFLKKQILGYKQWKQIEICYSYTIGLVVNFIIGLK